MTATLDATASAAEVTAARPPRLTGRWLGPLAVTGLGGILRLWDLGQPHALVFDETYYAKDALSLLLFGAERTSAPKADERILAGDGTLDPAWFTDDGSFVVHPPLGKWVIAAGEHVFGATPFGWRIAVAILGTLSILILARAVLRLTGSALWGTVAGLLLAIDGMAVVMSRTAVLDGVLAFFVLSAFALLLVDRDWARSGRTPGSWWRPWRLAAAAALGMACAVKWSALWYLAAFLVLTVLWEAARRRRAGESWLPAMLRDAVPTGLTLLPVAILVYLASWTGWFLADVAWDRQWNEGTGPLAALSSWWHYHAEMWRFHVGLSTEHSYQSSAFGWLLQARPTSFYYQGDGLVCDSGDCSQAVTALGNPLLWWAAAVALLHQVWRWAAHRDWRSGAVLLGVLAGWAPWLAFPDRTIFSFYAVVFTPFLVAALTLSLAAFVGSRTLSQHDRRAATRHGRNGQSQAVGRACRDQRPFAHDHLPVVSTGSTDGSEGACNTSLSRIAANGMARWRVGAVAAFLLACVLTSWFFSPIWTAEVMDRSAWGQRMWLNTWV